MTNNEKVKKYYNDIYNEENRLDLSTDNRHRVEFELRIEHIKSFINENTKRILDISCGTGVITHELSKQFPDIEFTACDLMERNIEYFNKIKMNNVETFVCNALDLPLENNQFDLVILAGAIYHLHDFKDKKQCVDEALRVSNNNLVLVEFLPKLHALINQQRLRVKEHSKLFAFNTVEEMKSLVSSRYNVEFFTSDFITRYVQKEINDFNDTDFNSWKNFVVETQKEFNVIDISEHATMVINGAN